MQARFESHTGNVCKLLIGFGDICPSQWNITGRLRMLFADCLTSCGGFQHPDQFEQLHGTRVTEIEYIER